MHAVYLDNKVVGNAQVVCRGLYYEITCRCRFPDQGKYRVHITCGNVKTDLGLCVPFVNGFGFKTAIRKKTVGEGEIRFFAIKEGVQEHFVEVVPDKPFVHLIRLRKATFQNCRDIVGVILPK